MNSSSQYRILVIITEPVLRDLVVFRLELLGYQVTGVNSALEATDVITNDAFALVLIDTTLQDGDGLEKIAALRTRSDNANVGFLVISLDPSLETVQRAHLLGANDYLITPFDPTVLEGKIVEAIEASHSAGHLV